MSWMQPQKLQAPLALNCLPQKVTAEESGPRKINFAREKTDGPATFKIHLMKTNGACIGCAWNPKQDAYKNVHEDDHKYAHEQGTNPCESDSSSTPTQDSCEPSRHRVVRLQQFYVFRIRNGLGERLGLGSRGNAATSIARSNDMAQSQPAFGGKRFLRAPLAPMKKRQRPATRPSDLAPLRAADLRDWLRSGCPPGANSCSQE